MVLVVLAFGCKPEKITKSIEVGDLTGKWNIFHVTRNGKVTKTLENGFFVFQADNTIKSNLFPEENSHTFKFERDKIDIEGLDNLNNFKIESIKNDTMVLESKVNIFDMKFYLRKGL